MDFYTLNYAVKAVAMFDFVLRSCLQFWRNSYLQVTLADCERLELLCEKAMDMLGQKSLTYANSNIDYLFFW